MSDLIGDLILALAAAIAGAVNAVAGGGTFVTFPALTEIALVLPVVANATNTVALFPGNFASAWAYRNDLSKPQGVSVWLLLAIAIAGSTFGAWLVTVTSDATFLKVVPWLLLFATVLFAAGNHIARWLQAHAKLAPWWLAAGMVPVAIYGGYFGAAMGIVQLALFAVIGMTDLNRMNALKTIFYRRLQHDRGGSVRRQGIRRMAPGGDHGDRRDHRRLLVRALGATLEPVAAAPLDHRDRPDHLGVLFRQGVLTEQKSRGALCNADLRMQRRYPAPSALGLAP